MVKCKSSMDNQRYQRTSMNLRSSEYDTDMGMDQYLLIPCLVGYSHPF